MSISIEYIANRYVALLADTAINAGLDGTRLLQAAELDAEVLTAFDGVTALPKFFRLIDVIVGQVPAIGIEFGRILNISTSGKLAELLISSRTLYNACAYASRFFPLAGLPISVEVQLVGDTLAVKLLLPPACYADSRFADTRFEHYCRAIKRRRFFVEFNLISWLRHIQFLIRDDYHFYRLELDFPEPEYASVVQAEFGCPIRYDSSAIRVFFSVDTLNRPLPSANPVIEKMQYNSCCSQLRKQQKNRTFSDQIRQLLLRNAHLHSLEQVASQINMSARSLSKQLRQEKVSFRQLLQSVKRKKACKFLCGGKHTVGEVARMLGYNDTANFRRSFKAWTGVSPSAYIKRTCVTTSSNAAIRNCSASPDSGGAAAEEDFISEVASGHQDNDRGKNSVSDLSIS